MKIREYQDRRYEIVPKRFWFDVTMPGILTIIVLIVCLYQMFKLQSINNIYVLFAVAAAYNIFNSFISLSNPRVVELTQETIQFNAFGQKHAYSIEDIKNFNVREFPSGGLIYLRIDPSLLRGRYWIKTKKYEEGKELFQRILDLDYQKNPDSLKSYAKRTSVKAKEVGLKRKKR